MQQFLKLDHHEVFKYLSILIFLRNVLGNLDGINESTSNIILILY